MKYPEKWTVKHEMTIRLKIAAVTHAILLLQKINISRSIHTTHVQRGFSDEKFMTRKYFNGKCQEIKIFFSFHGCAYKHQLHISELYTYDSTYISSFWEYKRCISEMTQISHKNLQMSDKIFVKCQNYLTPSKMYWTWTIM